MDNQFFCYVSVDGDSIGAAVGRASLADDVAEIRRLSNVITAGNTIWSSWTLAVGGEVVGCGGDECRLKIPASKLGDIPGLRAEYESTVGTTCTVGVGRRMTEADKALMAGKMLGKDRVTTYSPEVEEIISKASQPKDEQDKIFTEYLQVKKAEDSTPNHAENFKELADKDARKQLVMQSAATHESEGEELKGIKAQAAEIIVEFQQKLPQLEEIKQQDPQLYQSLTSAMQVLLVMANKLFGEPEQVAKTEELAKGAMSRLYPYNPAVDSVAGKRNFNESKGRVALADWQMHADPKDRQKIPQMKGNVLERGLHKLHAVTQVRRNNSGEREFLLHRSMGSEEFGKSHNNGVLSPDKNSSWAPHANYGSSYAAHTVSAWIPESSILSIPKQYGTLKYREPGKGIFDKLSHEYGAGGKNEMAPEHEVVLKPGAFQVHSVKSREIKKTEEHETSRKAPDIEDNASIINKSMSPDEFQSLIAANKQKREHVKSLATHLAATTSGSVWKSKHNPNNHFVVGLDPHNRNQWRVTNIESGEPNGHTVSPTHEEAIHAAADKGADMEAPVRVMSKQSNASFLSKEEFLEGGAADGMEDIEFDPEQLAIGIKHEMEHTDNPDIAKEVAEDHLAEDEDYYKKLKTIEKSNSYNHLVLPVGSQIDGGASSGHKTMKIKVRDPKTGKTKWRQVKSGMVMDLDGNPISSRAPNSD